MMIERRVGTIIAVVSVRQEPSYQYDRVYGRRGTGGPWGLIVQGVDGRIVALEVKLAATVSDHDTRHLRWLAERIGPDLADAAVITTGPEAYRRRDGVAVIPAALLTA